MAFSNLIGNVFLGESISGDVLQLHKPGVKSQSSIDSFKGGGRASLTARARTLLWQKDNAASVYNSAQHDGLNHIPPIQVRYSKMWISEDWRFYTLLLCMIRIRYSHSPHLVSVVLGQVGFFHLMVCLKSQCLAFFYFLFT